MSVFFVILAWLAGNYTVEDQRRGSWRIAHPCKAFSTPLLLREIAKNSTRAARKAGMSKIEIARRLCLSRTSVQRLLGP